MRGKKYCGITQILNTFNEYSEVWRTGFETFLFIFNSGRIYLCNETAKSPDSNDVLCGILEKWLCTVADKLLQYKAH